MKILKTAALFAVTTTGALLLASACDGSSDDRTPEQSNPVEVVVVTPAGSATPRIRRTATPSPSPTTTPLQVCSANPDAAPLSQLQVEEPKPGAQVTLPVHVRGWGANIGQDEKGLSVSVVDQKANVLQVNNLPPLPRDYRVAPGGMQVTDFTRPFAADIVLSNVTAPTPYCLWVYLGTTETGRATGVVQVPIVVVPR